MCSMTNRGQVRTDVEIVFREVFDRSDLVVTDEMVANDVESWDSLVHITLVIALEERFDIRFSTREVMGWKNVGEMIDTLIERG
jgi:acyl carrier protein